MTKSPSASLLLAVFALSLLLSAGLLFNIQPMIGKMLLPRVGGSPASWNVVMAFFQLALLAGYLLAHLLSRLPALWHGLVYLAALVLSASFLPIALPAGWQPDTTGSMPLAILHVLTLVVAVPFVALSLSAPTLQRLFAATSHEQAADPYFLYVASNCGSFIGLLIYPLLIEPNFGVSAQAAMWQTAFWGLIIVATLALLAQARHAVPALAQTAATTGPAPTTSDRLLWVLLAFIPSSLTLGVTTHITTDIAATPLLWVVTLGLYLLTFIVAFARRGERLRQLSLQTYPWFASLAVAACLLPVSLPWTMVGLHLLAFTTTALACHSQLSQKRPQAGRLTEFYFWLSVGGALGGSFNAFLAPLVFDKTFEYPIVLMLGLATQLTCYKFLLDPRQRQIVAAVLLVVLTTTVLGVRFNIMTDTQNVYLLLIGLIAIALVLLRIERRLFVLAGTLLVGSFIFFNSYSHFVYQGRDFFGVISVFERQDPDTNQLTHVLQHGTTTHGMQIYAPQRLLVPTGYYAPETPIGLAWHALRPRSIALIGLGTGALNCYATPGDRLHFFEIDPLMVEVAQKYFTFLSECTPPEITVGDGRLELARDTGKYDMIVLDAFSSDSIPVHIISREAFQMYLGKLNPGGVIAAHISSRFFRLEPMLAAIADDLHLTALTGISDRLGMAEDTFYFPAKWMLIAPDATTLSSLQTPDSLWRPARTSPGIRAWTDEYSNIVSVLQWGADAQAATQ